MEGLTHDRTRRTLGPPLVPFFLTPPGDRGLVLSAAILSAVQQKWPSVLWFSHQGLERSRTYGNAYRRAAYGHDAEALSTSVTAKAALVGNKGSRHLFLARVRWGPSAQPQGACSLSGSTKGRGTRRNDTSAEEDAIQGQDF